MARKRNSRLKDSGNNMKKSVIIYLSPFTGHCLPCLSVEALQSEVGSLPKGSPQSSLYCRQAYQVPAAKIENHEHQEWKESDVEDVGGCLAHDRRGKSL